jgi:hypothetical protein
MGAVAVYNYMQSTGCEEAYDALYATKLCLEDKNFKCFVTPDDLTRYRTGYQKYIDQDCVAEYGDPATPKRGKP